MENVFKKCNDYCGGWLGVILIIILEIIIVYPLSNIPFIFTALDAPISPENPNFLTAFNNVLEGELSKGQLLTFVCASVAPVLFWAGTEFKKAFMTKALSFASLVLLLLCVYLHGKQQEEFTYFSSYGLYIASLIVWFLAILSREIPPPDNKLPSPNQQATILSNHLQHVVEQQDE